MSTSIEDETAGRAVREVFDTFSRAKPVEGSGQRPLPGDRLLGERLIQELEYLGLTVVSKPPA